MQAVEVHYCLEVRNTCLLTGVFPEVRKKSTFFLASASGIKQKKGHPSHRTVGLLSSEGSDIWLFLLIQLGGEKKKECCSLPTGNPFILQGLLP